MKLQARKNLLAFLLCAFIIQSFLVYFDDNGRKHPIVSELAKEGQKLWFSHNCQSCHQIYGFGGFLGPDLTNVSKRLSAFRLDHILTEGSAQMPAYHFDKEQRRQLLAFFKSINKTGKGTPSLRNDDSANPIQHFHTSVAKVLGEDVYLSTSLSDFAKASSDKLARDDEDYAHQGSAKTKKSPSSRASLSDEALAKSESPTEKHEIIKKGFELVQHYACINCHLPNERSLYKAPDLSLLSSVKTEELIMKTLVNGKVEKGMPPLPMSLEEQKSVVNFLKWLHKNRKEFLKNFHNVQELSAFEIMKRVPWYEYK